MMKLADPCSSQVSCIPNGIPTNSLKAQAFAKGTFGGSVVDNTVTPLNYNGTAFVSIAPFLGMQSDNHGSDGAPVKSSFSGTGTSTGTEGSTINNQTGGSTVQSNYTNAGYTDAQIAAGSVQWRLVSACIRARFMGSTMHNAGRMIGLVEPDHEDLTGLTASQLEAYDEATKVEFSSNGTAWFEVLYNGPTVAKEFAWSGNENSTSMPTQANYFMAIAVTNCESGVTAVPFAGEWEAYMNYEYIGPVVRGKTISFADPSGFSAAVSVAANFSKIQKETQNDKNPKKTFLAKVWGGFKKALAYSGPVFHVVKAVGGSVAKAIATENYEALEPIPGQLLKGFKEIGAVTKAAKAKKKLKKEKKALKALVEAPKKKIIVRAKRSPADSGRWAYG